MAWMLAGCGLPSHMQVRTADDPQNVDKEVRFRTTYYFRVFDQCQPLTPGKLSNAKGGDPIFGPATKREPVVLNDSLYRFRMTGKANATTNKIHFESGTLKAFQIDPFGANVAFDEKNQRFYPISQKETIANAKRAQAEKDAKEELEVRHVAVGQQIERLVKLREQLIENNALTDKNAREIDTLILKSIKSLGALSTAPRATLTASLELVDVAHVKGVQLTTGINEAAVRVRELEDSVESRPSEEWPNKPFEPLTAPVLPEEGKQFKEAEALHKEREWYELQVNLAQDQLIRIQSAVQWIEGKSTGIFDKEKEAKESRDLAKRRLEDFESLYQHYQNTLVVCQDQSKLYLNARKTYRTRKGLAQAALNVNCDAQELPELLEDDVEADKKRNDDEKLRSAASAYSEAHLRMTESFREHKAAKQRLEEAITQLASVQPPLGVDPKNFDVTRTRLKEEERMKRADYDGEVNKATARRKVITDAKHEENLVEDRAQTLAELASSINLLSASLVPTLQSSTPLATASTKDSPACPEGLQRRRGFQVLGPEGFRTFDQDERLIMAMSSSGKPLLSVIQELSGRVLNQQATESDRLLPIANERIKILRAQRLVDRAEKDALKDVKALNAFFEKIRKAFGNK